MQAFSEAFVSTSVGKKKRRKARDERHVDLGYLADASQDHKYHVGVYSTADQGAPEESMYSEKPGLPEERGYHEESGYREPSDSRRSSDLYYEGFHADDDSMISGTSGYATPTVSEDTSSKRTTSISGDEGRSTPNDEDKRLSSVSAIINVASYFDCNNKPRPIELAIGRLSVWPPSAVRSKKGKPLE